MADEPMLLFIHGHHGDKDFEKFVDVLRVSLENEGLDKSLATEIATSRLLAPNYSSVLDNPPGSAPALPRTPIPPGIARAALKSSYQERTREARDRLRFLADGPRRGPLSPLPRSLVDVAAIPTTRLGLPGVHEYLTNKYARRAVLQHLLDQIDGYQDLVIAAHSLGTVVLAGLLPRLPEGTRVRLMLTMGSPLRLAPVRRQPDLRSDFPYHVVDLWLNLYDPRDPATLWRGVQREYPDAVDVTVKTQGKHPAFAYIATAAAASELRRVFQPSATRDVPRDSTEQRSRDKTLQQFSHPLLRLVWLRQLVANEPNPKIRNRLAQANTHLEQLYRDSAQPSPSPDLSKHVFDALAGSYADYELLMQLVLLYSNDPVSPFDFKLAQETRVKALAGVIADLGGADSLARLRNRQPRGDKRSPEVFAAEVIADELKHAPGTLRVWVSGELLAEQRWSTEADLDSREGGWAVEGGIANAPLCAGGPLGSLLSLCASAEAWAETQSSPALQATGSILLETIADRLKDLPELQFAAVIHVLVGFTRAGRALAFGESDVLSSLLSFLEPSLVEMLEQQRQFSEHDGPHVESVKKKVRYVRDARSA